MIANGAVFVYAALAVWAGLLVQGFRKQSCQQAFLAWGIALMMYVNAGYFIAGAPASIAAFVGIYDVLINVGLNSSSEAGLSTCEDNARTVWGDRYINHPAWGSALYDRFAKGPEFRSTLLYGHILFNSVVFVMMHVQFLRPGYGEYLSPHKLLGRLTFVFLTIGVACGVRLASEHGSVVEYGGRLAAYGFYSMAAPVFSTAIMGIVTIRSGRTSEHRIWMFRFVGSLWGAFWLFRVVLFVLDPLLRNHETDALLISIWGSAPAGILVAEIVRRRLDRPTKRASSISTVT